MYRILFIANEIQIGGATKELIHLASNLKSEFKPIILMNKLGPLSEMCERLNIEYAVLKYKAFSIGEGSTKMKRIIKKLLVPFLKFEYLMCNKIALYRIKYLIDMEKISLIHTNVNRDDFGALLSRKYNIPHVWHLREFGDSDYKCYYFRKNYIDFMNKNTESFIAISKVIQESFIKKGIDAKKIPVIYDGIKINKDFNKKINDNKLRILFMGNIQEAKGQIELIEALHLLPVNVLNNIYVDFYGAGGKDYIKFLKRKVNEYSLKNIKFNGYTHDIEKIIKNYDVGIMCSKSEAFGLVTIEYMTNKLITIVPNTGACPELVTKNSGFIYEHGNYKNLSDIIFKIYNMTLEEKYNLSQNGFERAKFFSSKNNARKIEKLYEQLLE